MLTWAKVLGWRLGRQFLGGRAAGSALEVATRLAGVQTQVASAAEAAVGVRRATPDRGEPARALEARTIVKTWAMRGTLHALPAADLPAYLSLVAAARSWEQAAWQRTFATTEQLAAIAEAASAALADRVLTREELVAEVARRTGDEAMTEPLRSGWGAVLKPLAWQGLLCHAGADGNRVRFARPDTWLDGWTGLPDPQEAARTVIPAYLGAYGPASVDTFDQWLTRGASRPEQLRSWFIELGDELRVVEVEGRHLYARASDLDDLRSARPASGVRLLPAFDQYVLGPGTAAPEIVDAARRPLVSRAAGWISPVVLWRGRVAGVWEIEDGELAATLFSEAGDVPMAELAAQTEQLAGYLGTPLKTTVTTI